MSFADFHSPTISSLKISKKAPLQLIRRLRIPAIFCALCVLVCELIARPCAAMSICDDGPYILMARTLATTGHIVYNGWAAPMLGWQLYLAAAFIKLFGFSFTAVRSCTVLVAMALAFILQRTLVLAGITERNATLGTLAFVLSPLYLMLSATFMTDIFGLFAIVLCLYGCLRALQSSSDRSTIAWLCFAVLTNAVCGTSRQIAWLGILVMVPSTLWLLRARRRVFLIGAAANLAGIFFVFVCMQWLKHQPYLVPIPLLVRNFPAKDAMKDLALLLLELPFLLLPITAIFFPEIRRARTGITASVLALLLAYSFLASYPSHLRGDFRTLLQPTSLDWVSVSGILIGGMLHGHPLVFLLPWVRVLFTFITYGGLIGVAITWVRSRRAPSNHIPSGHISWRQLSILLGPFILAYLVLLLCSVGSNHNVYDRYAFALLIVALLCLVRLYQEYVRTQLPALSILLLLFMAAYGVAVTYNNDSFYRARVALANELRNAGVPATSVDNGWEYNIDVELQYANHINDPRILDPADSYVPVASPAGICQMFWYDRTPHIHPLYGVSFDPNACYGPAPFAPVHYSRWPYRTPGTLYVVRYTPPTKP
jgi:hypothetical protein